MENKRKHLEFIQGIISRMGGNLFFLRGWTITLIGALLALFSKNNSPDYIFYFLILVVFILWILDGYFLSQERSYRDLYNHVRKLKEEDIDFSLDISVYQKYKKNTLIYSMFSYTLLVFYIPLISVAFFIMYQLK
jgi:ammonia channel protein AmtB